MQGRTSDGRLVDLYKYCPGPIVKVSRNKDGSDKIQQFNIQLGEIITANIGLKAHQSKEGRWFNQLDCWKVERPNGQHHGQVVQSQINAAHQIAGGYYQPQQQPIPLSQQQQFPPQVNASGQPIQQNAQCAGGQQKSNLQWNVMPKR